jgi:tRNA-2-methylthio-N6-dimethylallyladenosine synthase
MWVRKRLIPLKSLRPGLATTNALQAGAQHSTQALQPSRLDAAAESLQKKRLDISAVPSLHDFIRQKTGASPAAPAPDKPIWGRIYIETYGCQQNSGDSEIILAVLAKEGYVKTDDMHDADVILTNTCAIRDNAERKVWNRLDVFKAAAAERKARLKREEKLVVSADESRIALEEEANELAAMKPRQKPIVGVLGCMAERLKGKLLESGKGVDLVVGPDQYRALPSMINSLRHGGDGALEGGIVNTALSYDENYADITPLREDPRKLSAFLSIQRGCK